MTDEERDELILNLNWYGTASQPDRPSGRWAVAAANELERLAKKLAEAEAALRNASRSDAEPVAWEYKAAEGWQRISLENYKILKGSSFELRPVFDIAPPRPDASAGLIEAAEIAESLAREFERRHDELKKYSLDNDHRWIDFYPRIAQGCEEAAQSIRVRAADRSDK